METTKSKLLSKLLIIKESLLIVALIIGGIWGLYKYVMSNDSAVSFDVKFDTKQEKISEDEYYLNTVVSLKNVGGSAYHINWGIDPCFYVFKVETNKSNIPEYKKVSMLSIFTPLLNEEEILRGQVSNSGIGSNNTRTFSEGVQNFVSVTRS